MIFARRSIAVAAAAALLSATPAAVTAIAQPQTSPPNAPAAASPDASSPNKGLATRAIEAAKNAASQAGDILTRVPCRPSKGIADAPGSLPRVAKRLAAGDPVTIVAFGSSTTVGFGTSSPAYTYPNRLADQLRRKFPMSDISIVNRGMGGQDAPEMMKRFDSAVLASEPDLVIWQLGTNTVIKGAESDIAATTALVEDGIARLQQRGIDIVLIDPQYAPMVNEKKENASRMVKLIAEVAKLKKVVLFPRFEVMRQWHDNDKMPFDSFVIADGLHMNDWGYACFAQLLGDAIIKSVGEVKAGVTTPANTMKLRPM